jgi:hypothetical protein
MTMPMSPFQPFETHHAFYALRGRAGSSHKLGRAVALAKSKIDLEFVMTNTYGV